MFKNAFAAVALTVASLSHAYGIDQIANQGAGQIIGIVDALTAAP